MTRSTSTEVLLALLLGALLIGFGASVTGDVSTQPDHRASSYVTDAAGTRALFDILHELDARPERLRDVVGTLPDTDRTLVICAPSEPFTDADVESLLDWVARGGRLVLAAAAPRPPHLSSHHRRVLDALGLRVRRRMSSARSLSIQPGAGIDASLLLDWPAVQVLDDAPPGSERDPRAGAAAPLVVTRSDRLAVRVPFGPPQSTAASDDSDDAARGEVIVFADELVFTNRHMRSEENAAFVVDVLLERPGDATRVVFDELHHGYLPVGEREGLEVQAARLLVATWPGRGVLVCVLGFLVLLLGRGPRLGAPVPEPAPPRRELSEHADALGRLLERSRARGAALRMIEAGVRRAVAPRAGLAASLDGAAFRSRLAQSPADGAAELAAALERAATTRPENDGDLKTAAHELAVARRRYLHGGS